VTLCYKVSDIVDCWKSLVDVGSLHCTANKTHDIFQPFLTHSPLNIGPRVKRIFYQILMSGNNEGGSGAKVQISQGYFC